MSHAVTDEHNDRGPRIDRIEVAVTQFEDEVRDLMAEIRDTR